MKIIRKDFSHNLKLDKYFNDSNCCFIDIETTGFSRSKDKIYLIGLLYYNKKIKLWTLIQFLADELSKEEEILNELVRILPRFNTLITYNGNSFDIPFINARLKSYSIPYEISKENSFDLYNIVKENRNYLNMENMKLKTLERYLGIFRNDIYSGKDCIEFYYNYLESKDEVLEERLLLHNYDDLFYMLDTIKILDVIKDIKTFSVLINNKKIDCEIENIIEFGDNLVFTGFIKGRFELKLLHYGSNYKVVIDESNRFEISIEYRKGLITPTQECTFIYRDDFYIPDEILDTSIYRVPDNVILLGVEKNYEVNNIKSILIYLINKIIEK